MGIGAGQGIRSTGFAASPAAARSAQRPATPTPTPTPRDGVRPGSAPAGRGHLWRIYQDIIDAYADADRRRGKTRLTGVIDTIRTGVPDVPDELAHLGRTLHRRVADVLAYFEYRASNGPTEAINGRLEVSRRYALGFRNLLHYRIRSLLHCGKLTHAIDAL